MPQHVYEQLARLTEGDMQQRTTGGKSRAAC